MSTKLTLVMEPDVVKTAKQYARNHRTSVSKLVEHYLALVSNEDGEGLGRPVKLGPLTSALAGAVNVRPQDVAKSADKLINEARMERFG
ncbi:MAG: DUF6364 family protein [Lentisphaeria bacterium]|nr:DUF6364 family protein [Lentisphaeria bacterium]